LSALSIAEWMAPLSLRVNSPTPTAIEQLKAALRHFVDQHRDDQTLINSLQLARELQLGLDEISPEPAAPPRAALGGLGHKRI
jgi:hypothetical protein